jgi:AhpD family alkylhydroperoxidase
MEKKKENLLTPKEQEFVAIAASVAGNCLRSLRLHFQQAIDKGCSLEEIEEVVDISRSIKERPINDIYQIAIDLLTDSRENVRNMSDS